MRAGKFSLKIINCGYFAMDCGAIFGIIPKAIWQNKVKCDEKNRLMMSMNCLLLESENQKILVDTGTGNGLGDKLNRIYNIKNSESILNTLKKCGLAPEDITDVICTHLHFDHAGGLIGHKTKILYFPNAKYYVSKKQYEWTMNPQFIIALISFQPDGICH